jgi:protein TonB
MEIKKTRRADLQNRRGLFLEIGLVVGLGVVVVAFAVGQSEKVVEKVDMGVGPVEQEIVEVTRQDEKPPEIKVQPMEVISDFINVRKNDTQITTDFDFAEFSDDFVVEVPQAVVEEEVDDIPLLIAEEMPKFQGGDLGKFRSWVNQEIKYPRIAAENNIQGKVILKFVIERDGTLTNIEEMASPDRSLTEETVRILKMSPKWTPGKQRDKPVRVAYVLTIDYVLQQ